jgi:hypothetical protein
LGASPAGGFVGPDVGVSVGWVNDVLTPFGTLQLGLGVPFAERLVNLSEIDEPLRARPMTTLTVQSSLGVHVLPRSRVSFWASANHAHLEELGDRAVDSQLVTSRDVFGLTGGLRLRWAPTD